MQRFLRKKPVRVTLATLLGVYRAVMRLSSIADALDDAIEEADDNAKEAGETAHEADTKDTKITDSQHGGLLMRELLILPLQQVSPSHLFADLPSIMCDCWFSGHSLCVYSMQVGAIPAPCLPHGSNLFHREHIKCLGQVYLVLPFLVHVGQ